MFQHLTKIKKSKNSYRLVLSVIDVQRDSPTKTEKRRELKNV